MINSTQKQKAKNSFIDTWKERSPFRKLIRKRPYLPSILLGFWLAILVSSLTFTISVKNKIQDEQQAILVSESKKIADSLSYNPYKIYNTAELYAFAQPNYTNYILASFQESSKNQMFTAALYDADGNKVAQSTSSIGFTFRQVREDANGTEQSYGLPLYFPLYEYFTEEEIAQLYLYQSWQNESFGDLDYSYHAYGSIHAETGELMRVQVFTEHYEPNPADEDSLISTGKILEWNWVNPNLKPEDPLLTSSSTRLTLVLPYYQFGEEVHEKWRTDEYLQNYPESFEGGYVTLSEYNDMTYWEKSVNGVTSDITYPVSLLGNPDTTYTLKIRQFTHSWAAAFEYLKTTYAFMLIFLMYSFTYITRETGKVYDKQKQLNDTRRDFTNAIAHELKTPLGIIRGFAENVKENTNEDKKEYYLDQIIKQTESMDKMVKEMIYISKLDSDKMTLQKDKVDFEKLVAEELEKFDVVINEKNLKIKYTTNKNDTSSSIIWDCDPYYMEKVIWNLISNAVEYSYPDGVVQIHLTESEFVISNTGPIISEEDLPHVCDMFFTGDKSRHSKEKHLGLGLYLANRIVEMHDKKLKIHNLDNGVEVKIN